ncbi:hypothetical protein [Anaerovibrio sp.]|uniref:hypothetical protein n=1 Tax=Anaerovibrio sp. TaxID=1872532 RepID=UPI003F143162
MKTTLKPAMATAGITGGGNFNLDFLPKFETFTAGFSASITCMRIGVFAAMLALCAVIINL